MVLRTQMPLSCDDGSVSSTITVDRLEGQKRHLTVRVNKAVTFNLQASSAYRNTIYCKEDVAQLWFQSADFKSFKRTTIGMSKSIVKAESQNSAPFSYNRVLERAYSVCKQTICEAETFQSVSLPSDRTHLQRWAQVAPSRVGMEKWAITSIAKEKRVRRFEVVDAVLDLQDVGASEEEMRIASQRVSRPSRLFANAMACAIAEAWQQEADREMFFQ